MGQKMKNKDIKIDIIKKESSQINIENKGTFVRIEHLKSGITVTKFNKIQIKAKNKAIDELKLLLKIYYRDEVIK